MKIKLLKDIPGYKTGEIVITDDDELGIDGNYDYFIPWLLANGWAEEVKEGVVQVLPAPKGLLSSIKRIKQRRLWKQTK
jgi:hypothetical protein